MKNKISLPSVLGLQSSALLAICHYPFAALAVLRHLSSALLLTSALCLLTSRSFAATVTGNLTDISLQALNTKITFTPTNEVLLNDTGLSAGPARTIDVANGQFSLVLDSGDYTVSLPLIPYRHPFKISVFQTNGPLNITNLLSPPRTYIYTNAYVPPFHVNAAQTVSWSTNGETSLLDSSATIPAGSLTTHSTIRIEAFGSFSDPGGNSPLATIRLKLGGTTIFTQAKNVGSSSWHLVATITLRSGGASAAVVSGMSLIPDDGSAAFPMSPLTATVDTTASLALNLTAAIANVTGAESVTCDQLAIHLE